jgi:hypothetical protein
MIDLGPLTNFLMFERAARANHFSNIEWKASQTTPTLDSFDSDFYRPEAMSFFCTYASFEQ